MWCTTGTRFEPSSTEARRWSRCWAPGIQRDHLPGAINLPLRKIEAEARGGSTRACRSSSIAGTRPETSAREPRGGSNASGSPRSTTTSTASSTGSPPDFPSKDERAASTRRRRGARRRPHLRPGRADRRGPRAGPLGRMGRVCRREREPCVLGLLRERELGEGHDEPVEQVMRPGPSTFRPYVPIEEMARSW